MAENSAIEWTDFNSWSSGAFQTGSTYFSAIRSARSLKRKASSSETIGALECAAKFLSAIMRSRVSTSSFVSTELALRAPRTRGSGLLFVGVSRKTPRLRANALNVLSIEFHASITTPVGLARAETGSTIWSILLNGYRDFGGNVIVASGNIPADDVVAELSSARSATFESPAGAGPTGGVTGERGPGGSGGGGADDGGDGGVDGGVDGGTDALAGGLDDACCSSTASSTATLVATSLSSLWNFAENPPGRVTSDKPGIRLTISLLKRLTTKAAAIGHAIAEITWVSDFRSSEAFISQKPPAALTGSNMIFVGNVMPNISMMQMSDRQINLVGDAQ
jgi:hypothetical protein